MDHVIFALATPHGRAAMGVLRVSGPNCIGQLAPFLKSAGSRPSPVFKGKRYLNILNIDSDVIDDCVVLFYPGPFSYTGEESLEISCHGNPLIVANLMSLFRHLGWREAFAGEFTQRAFLNGKVDLARAEAINDLIHAETMAGVRMARAVSSGQLELKIHGLQQNLLSALAYLEAHIDFGQDDVGEFQSSAYLPYLDALYNEISILERSFGTGLVLKEGFKVVLCGKPNAGKSTLFNALLQSDRSIVTNIAGTTRDYIEERFKVGNRDFVLTDTAGLQDTTDPVERIGISRTWTRVAQAHLILVLVDASSANHIAETDLVLAALRSQGILATSIALIVTKYDLVDSNPRSWRDHTICQNLQDYYKSDCYPIVPSYLGHAGHVQEFLKISYDAQFGHIQPDSVFLISERQHQKAALAMGLVAQAKALARGHEYPEKIASVLHRARIHLEEMIGHMGTEDVLGAIFSSFCIGK